ncbi:unnamed protein product, partial [Rotaria sp. Silwood2]
FVKVAVVAVENDTLIYFSKLSSKIDIELYTNQLLVLLVRCVYLYDNVRSICANVDYVEELLYIYRSSKNRATILLALKILRNIIPLLPESETTIITIKSSLDEFLFSIGNNFTKQNRTLETISELINVFRTIMSLKSPWQMMATQLVFNSIVSCGYLSPYCLGSVVNVYPNEESNEFDLALIIAINTNDQNSNSSEVLPYFIQYLQTNKTEWIAAEKLRIQIDFFAIKSIYIYKYQ